MQDTQLCPTYSQSLSLCVFVERASIGGNLAYLQIWFHCKKTGSVRWVTEEAAHCCMCYFYRPVPMSSRYFLPAD